MSILTVTIGLGLVLVQATGRSRRLSVFLVSCSWSLTLHTHAMESALSQVWARCLLSIAILGILVTRPLPSRASRSTCVTRRGQACAVHISLACWHVSHPHQFRSLVMILLTLVHHKAREPFLCQLPFLIPIPLSFCKRVLMKRYYKNKTLFLSFYGLGILPRGFFLRA